MLNRSASLAMSTSVLKSLPGKLDIKRHSPSILYLPLSINWCRVILHVEAAFDRKFGMLHKMLNLMLYS